MRIAPTDTFALEIDLDALVPGAEIRIVLRKATSNETLEGVAVALLDTEREVALIRAGGIIPMILQQALTAGRSECDT